MHQVVVLNADYSYLNIISWKRAIKLIFQKKVEVLKYSNKVIKGFEAIIKVPLVVRLIKFVRNIYKRCVPLSKKNVFIRDLYVCQYCGQKIRTSPTIDHIIPKSRGGTFSWTNVVTACIKCNQKKGNKLPSEAGLSLIKKPVMPTISEFFSLKLKLLGLEGILKDIW